MTKMMGMGLGGIYYIMVCLERGADTGIVIIWGTVEPFWLTVRYILMSDNGDLAKKQSA